MSAHTPGPWSVSPASGGGLIVHRAVQSLQVFPVEDAHLIAAAPELYEALSLVGALLWNPASVGGYRIDEIRNKANTAIAKAEGRS